MFHLVAAKSRFLHFFSPGLFVDNQLINAGKYHINITLRAHYFPVMFLPPVSGQLLLTSGLLPLVAAPLNFADHVPENPIATFLLISDILRDCGKKCGFSIVSDNQSFTRYKGNYIQFYTNMDIKKGYTL